MSEQTAIAAAASANAVPATSGNALAPDLATGTVHPAEPAEPSSTEAAAPAVEEGTAAVPTEEAAVGSAPAPEAAAEPAPVAAASTGTIVVHHLDDSRSQRILWLLEELGLQYEIKYYKRQATMRAPPELRKIHPLGKSPVITDGAVTLAESGAIIEYLLAKYGKGRFAPTEEGWVDNLYYSHYAEGSLQPVLVMAVVFTIIPGHSPLIVRPIARAICKNVLNQLVDPELKSNGEMIEAHLSKSPSGWFAGGPEPTSADFLMSFACETLSVRAGSSVGAKTKEFVNKVHARAAYKRALEKGGEYAYAK